MNSFNPEIQLKDPEYAIRNKLIDLLTELKDFKFMTILALEFKKEKMMIKKYSTFHPNAKAETITNESDIDMYLNKSLVLLYQLFKSL